VNPADFLDIADQLRTSPSEAGQRTSIGRSYYALYNVVYGTLISQGVRLENEGSDHKLLVYYLTTCRDREADKIGGALRDLHSHRIDADYHMQLSIDPQQSEFAYRLARKTVDRFNALGVPDVQRIVQLIRFLPPPPPSRHA